jgi:hypothetical protein
MVLYRSLPLAVRADLIILDPLVQVADLLSVAQLAPQGVTVRAPQETLEVAVAVVLMEVHPAVVGRPVVLQAALRQISTALVQLLWEPDTASALAALAAAQDPEQQQMLIMEQVWRLLP